MESSAKKSHPLANEKGMAFLLTILVVTMMLVGFTVVLLQYYQVKMAASRQYRNLIVATMVTENFGPIVAAAYETYRSSGLPPGNCPAGYLGLPVGNISFCFINDTANNFYTCIGHPVGFSGSSTVRQLCLTGSAQDIQQVASMQIVNPRPLREMYAALKEALPYAVVDVLKPFMGRSEAVAATSEEYLPDIVAEAIPANEIESPGVPYTCNTATPRSELCMRCDFSPNHVQGPTFGFVPCLNFRFCLFPDLATGACDNTKPEQWVYSRYATIGY